VAGSRQGGEARSIEKLFEQFGRHLEAKGYIAHVGWRSPSCRCATLVTTMRRWRPATPAARPRARQAEGGFRSRLHRRGSHRHPLSQAQEKANRRKSKIRAPRRALLRRAGKQTTIVPTIGIVRPRATNLVYYLPKHAVHAGRRQVRGGVRPRCPERPPGEQRPSRPPHIGQREAWLTAWTRKRLLLEVIPVLGTCSLELSARMQPGPCE
jgi:hypothetical protein